MFKEAESRPDKIESTSNNVQVGKKQQHRRRACALLVSAIMEMILSFTEGIQSLIFLSYKPSFDYYSGVGCGCATKLDYTVEHICMRSKSLRIKACQS